MRLEDLVQCVVPINSSQLMIGGECWAGGMVTMAILLYMAKRKDKW